VTSQCLFYLDSFDSCELDRKFGETPQLLEPHEDSMPHIVVEFECGGSHQIVNRAKEALAYAHEQHMGHEKKKEK
jgi:hypothetical protein